MKEKTSLGSTDGWLTCTSPDGNVAIGLTTDAQGMRWRLARKGQTLIAPSRLGLSLYKDHFNSNERPFVPREICNISRDEFIGMPATVEVAGNGWPSARRRS